MRKAAAARSAQAFANQARPPPAAGTAAAGDGQQSDAAIFLQSLQDPEIIERVRATIQNAHVFKLPPRQSASVGWRGADWKEKVWQGTVKVVERGDLTAVLLVDRNRGSIFAVCPVKEGAVDRCVDSSRYFVLRIENANGRHMFIGVAFNERNDAFDFNTALEDSRREREAEKNPVKLDFGPPKDYSIKEGEKIKVSIPRNVGSGKEKKQSSGNGTKKGLRPSTRDTPKRLAPEEPKMVKAVSQSGSAMNPFSDVGSSDPFSPGDTFGGTNFFQDVDDDPFFKNTGGAKNQFNPRNYKTESGR
mmetsp:Transcript_18039/g.41723  ORF Transcript_18039/g.41723 Transcript_18039/m.41723 type:complete len:303 (-) Transcript_18039:1679-2587(-)